RDVGVTLSRRLHREPRGRIKCRIRIPTELRLPEGGRICRFLGSWHKDFLEGSGQDTALMYGKSNGVKSGSDIGMIRSFCAMIARSAPYDAYVIVSIGGKAPCKSIY